MMLHLKSMDTCYKARELVERGHSMDKIHLDPGIGFGKTLEHNISLLKSSLELRPYSILWEFLENP